VAIAGSPGRSFFLGVLELTCPYGETGGGGFIALHVQFVFAGSNCSELSREGRECMIRQVARSWEMKKSL